MELINIAKGNGHVYVFGVGELPYMTLEIIMILLRNVLIRILLLLILGN